MICGRSHQALAHIEHCCQTLFQFTVGLNPRVNVESRDLILSHQMPPQTLLPFGTVSCWRTLPDRHIALTLSCMVKVEMSHHFLKSIHWPWKIQKKLCGQPFEWGGVGFLDLGLCKPSGLCILKAVVCLLDLELEKGNSDAVITF